MGHETVASESYFTAVVLCRGVGEFILIKNPKGNASKVMQLEKTASGGSHPSAIK